MGLLTSYKKTEVKIEKESKIITRFDYSDFEKKEKEILIELEQQALHYGTIISDSIQELGDVFKKAHQCFSNHKIGNFCMWYESLGYKKDFVYLCLDRKNLAVKYDNKGVYKLPDRAIKDIKKLDNKDETEIVYDILMDPEPTKKIKEIKGIEKEKYKIEETVMAEKITSKSQEKNEIMSKISFIEKKISEMSVGKKKKIKIIEMLEEIEKLLI